MNVWKRIKAGVRDTSGTMLIEMAIASPVLIAMAVGSFEVGVMVMRQHELQSALSEGGSIALAVNQGAETDLANLKDIIKDSVDLNDEQVDLAFVYRCGLSETLVNNKDLCSEDDIVSEYVTFKLQDSHEPIWSKLGFGTAITFDVERTVQLS